MAHSFGDVFEGKINHEPRTENKPRLLITKRQDGRLLALECYRMDRQTEAREEEEEDRCLSAVLMLPSFTIAARFLLGAAHDGRAVERRPRDRP